MAIGDILGGLGINFGGSGFIDIIIAIIIGSFALIIIGFIFWWLFVARKRWNLKIEFKIPRNIRMVKTKEGNLKVIGTLNKEWGKGAYNAKKGVVMIKRKGIKAVAMKPFDVKRFLSDNNILTVIQVGIEDYRPVLDESYIEVIDDETKETAALIKARIDTSESKSWKNTFERESKAAFTIKNWLQEHGQIVALGLVILLQCVGFAIVLSKLPK